MADEAQVATSEESAGDEVAGDEFDIDAPLEGDTFPREYVEKVRAEAAKNRVAAKEAREAAEAAGKVFEGYDPDTAQAWANWLQINATDPDRARAYIADAFRLTPAEAQQAIDAQQDETGDRDPDDLLTYRDLLDARREWEAELEERETRERTAAEERQAAAAKASIEAELKGLGFDPESRDAMNVLWFARNETQGDLKLAAEQYKATQEEIEQSGADKLVKARSADDAAATPPAAGAAPDQSIEPKGWDAARRSALERMAKA